MIGADVAVSPAIRWDAASLSIYSFLSSSTLFNSTQLDSIPFASFFKLTISFHLSPPTSFIEMWHRLSSSKLDLRTWSLGLGFIRRSFSSEPGKRFAALWGNGDFGRLGLGNLDSQWTPAPCTAFHNQNLKAIACGGAHTLFLTGSRLISFSFFYFHQIHYSSIFFQLSSENLIYSLPDRWCNIRDLVSWTFWNTMLFFVVLVITLLEYNRIVFFFCCLSILECLWLRGYWYILVTVFFMLLDGYNVTVFEIGD